MDIVERLNDDAQCFCSIRKEAADEIERLKAANRAFAEQVTNDYKEIKRLREALNQAQCGCELPCLQGEFCSSWICRSALQQKDSE